MPSHIFSSFFFCFVLLWSQNENYITAPHRIFIQKNKIVYINTIFSSSSFGFFRLKKKKNKIKQYFCCCCSLIPLLLLFCLRNNERNVSFFVHRAASYFLLLLLAVCLSGFHMSHFISFFFLAFA